MYHFCFVLHKFNLLFIFHMTYLIVMLPGCILKRACSLWMS